jgi:hypothetical protein
MKSSWREQKVNGIHYMIMLFDAAIKYGILNCVLLCICLVI